MGIFFFTKTTVTNSSNKTQNTTIKVFMLIQASQLRVAVRSFLSFKNFRIIFNYVYVCMWICAYRVCGFVHESVLSPEHVGVCMRVYRLQLLWYTGRD